MLTIWASISCAIFQRFSDALKHLIEYRTRSPKDTMTNYLDDFLFLALTLIRCNYLIDQFLILCDQLGVPIALEKTELADCYVTFLGILLDGKNMLLSIPPDKRDKAIHLLKTFIDRRKATVKELQELCRYLNFLCKAIFPGCPFVRRMYVKYAKIIDKSDNCQLKPHHHVRLDMEFKVDCNIWLQFLDDKKHLN